MSVKSLPVVDVVDAWANSVATNDNDIIQLRKKNGIIYMMKIEPFTKGKWEKLNPKSIPVIIDEHGAKLENATLAEIPKLINAYLEPKPIPQIDLGWYQDEKTDLFYYEGENVWRGIDPMRCTVLTDYAVSGKLEFIG